MRFILVFLLLFSAVGMGRAVDKWALSWVMSLPDATPPSAAGEKVAFLLCWTTRWGNCICIFGLQNGSWQLGWSFWCNEAYQACYLQEVCGDDSRLCPSLQQCRCISSAGSQALLSRAGAPGAFGEVICKADLYRCPLLWKVSVEWGQQVLAPLPSPACTPQLHMGNRERA